MSKARVNGKPIDGVLILDKPPSISSAKAVAIMKKLFNAQKVGHTGSLDPLASGLLPICFGRCTKLSQFLLTADKSYEVTLMLGEQRETGDAEGEVVAKAAVPKLSVADWQAILQGFVGEIEQVPPMYSALKHKGQPLYRLARKGVTIERAARPVTIYELRYLQLDSDCLRIFVRCSKGTYIRTLVEDIARSAGTVAYARDLRRVAAAGYTQNDAVSLAALQDLAQQPASLHRYLLPAASVVRHYPRVNLSALATQQVRHGRACALELPSHPGNKEGAAMAKWVQLWTAGEFFMGVGEILDDGSVMPRWLARPAQAAA